MQAVDEAPPIVVEQPGENAETSALPTERRADGSLVIDLTPLAPPPTECVDPQEPDPFNPEIVVCGKTMLSPRVGPDPGPSAAQVIEGSAVPRARLQLSDNASVEANASSSAVGGINGQGGEVRVRIDF